MKYQITYYNAVFSVTVWGDTLAEAQANLRSLLTGKFASYAGRIQTKRVRK